LTIGGTMQKKPVIAFIGCGNMAQSLMKVVSPNDIMNRALQNLESGGIRTLFNDALTTAKNRSVEISQMFDKE